MKTSTIKKPRTNGTNGATTPHFRIVNKSEAPPLTGVRKLNLGSIIKTDALKVPASASMIVSDETRALLSQFVKLAPDFKEFGDRIKSLKKQIAPPLKADYFTHFAGSGLPTSSPKISIDGKTVLLVFAEKYTTLCTDDSGLVATIGAELTGGHFRQATELKIELDKIAEEKQEPFVTAVIAAAEKFGISDGISAKQYIKPRAGFHAARTTLLSPEQNIALDGVLPFSAYPKLG
jgi:hypothetical protein